MRKKIEKNFWDMEIIGNRRKRSVLNSYAQVVTIGDLIHVNKYSYAHCMITFRLSEIHASNKE